MAVTIPSFTRAGLPAVPAAGDLARVTDQVRGVWMADGTTGPSWFSILGEVVNVKNFGARGDNSTDDSTAINNAITAAKGAVYFPPGDYVCNSPITLKAGITLFGASYMSSLLHFQTATQGLVFTPAPPVHEAGITIRDLSIYGNLTSTITLSLIVVSNAQFVELSNLSIRDTKNDCVALDGCRIVVIRNCRIGNATQKHVRLTNLTNVWAIEACGFEVDGKAGESMIYADTCGFGTVRNCEMEGQNLVQHAVELKDCTCIDVDTNFMEAFTGTVVEFIGPNICTNIRIARNDIHSITATGALVNAGSSVGHVGTLVEGNRFVAASGAKCFAPGGSTSSFLYTLNNHDPNAPSTDVVGFGEQEVERRQANVRWSDVHLPADGALSGATPSVKNLGYATVSNPSLISMTNLTNGVKGQVIILKFLKTSQPSKTA